MSTPFHKTVSGRIFLDQTLPALVKELSRLNDHLDKGGIGQTLQGPSAEGPKVVGSSPEKVRVLICGGCGYRLEYTLEHVHTSHGRDYDGGSSTATTLTCPRPSCARINTVSPR